MTNWSFLNPDFRSVFLGGFECSTHRRRDGTRLDLLDSTAHARLAEKDLQQLRHYGIRTVRSGICWHKVERRPGYYDWSSVLSLVRAAERTGTQVIWDLCHYGWPDDLDIWAGEFIDRFAGFAGAAARVISAEMDETPYFCPVNEISYFAWSGGEVGQMNPWGLGRGAELKRQLVRATIAAIDNIRRDVTTARFITAEPLINVVAGAYEQTLRDEAEAYHQSQFEAHDMLSGYEAPELGGVPANLDIIGLNYYPDNQWYFQGNTIPLGHHAYHPLRDLLGQVYRRYHRPMLIAETGAEGVARPYWLHHVGAEVFEAVQTGLPVFGICWYPIVDYPGWENNRECPVGLLSLPDSSGHRTAYPPLVDELKRQQHLLARLYGSEFMAGLG